MSFMETAEALERVTVEEYLSGELRSEVRHEFIDGSLYAMAGASEEHNTLAGNIFAALHTHIGDGPCRVFMADMKVRLQIARDEVLTEFWEPFRQALEVAKTKMQAVKGMETEEKCPQCGRQKLRRVFGTGSAILFKGSGFYQTDYRSESYKAGAKADAESSKPASDNGTTGKTDTPAAAPAKDSKGESKSTKSKS